MTLAINPEAPRRGTRGRAALEITAPETTSVRLHVQGTGDVRVTSRASANLRLRPNRISRSPINFIVGQGEGTVRVTTTISDGPDQGREQSTLLYVLSAGGEVFSGTSGMTALRIEAFERHQAPTLPADQLADAMNELLDLGGDVAPVTDPGVPDSGDPTGPGQSTSPLVVDPGPNQVGIEGRIFWTDEDGTQYPYRFGEIQVWEADFGPDYIVATLATDENGRYGGVFLNNDGIRSGRDLYVRVRTAGDGYKVAPALEILGNTVTLRDPHQVRSPSDQDVSDAENGETYDISFAVRNTSETGQAMSIHQTMAFGFEFSDRLLPGDPRINSRYPAPGTFLQTASGGRRLIFVNERQAFEWDALFHEFGHFVAQQLDIQDSPGGPHSLSDNLSEARGSKDVGTRLAWSEGFATFFGLAVQRQTGAFLLGKPGVGDVSFIVNGGGANVETGQDVEVFGEDAELAIAAGLWDVFDTADDVGDVNLSTTLPTMLRQLSDARAVTFSQAWSALTGAMTPSRRDRAACIASNWGMAPTPLVPAPGAVLRSNSPRVFSFARGGGGPAFLNDSFELQIEGQGLSITKSLPANTSSDRVSVVPTTDEWARIQATEGSITWQVTGRQQAAPATGPYRGCIATFSNAETPPTTTTTTAPPTTTVPPTTTPTTTPGTTAPGTTAPGTTAPGTTAPPTTAPGTTTPGTTAPPTSSPGTTAPGTTIPGTTVPPTTSPDGSSAVINGRVRGPGDQAVPGVVADLFTATPRGDRLDFVSKTDVVDQTYSFQVPAGCHIVVLIAPDGYTFSATRTQYQEIHLCLRAGQTYNSANARLLEDKPATIGGVVRDQRARFVPGVEADLFSGSQRGDRLGFLSKTELQARRFSIEVPAGCYVVVLVAPDGYAFIATETPYLEIPRCLAAGTSFTAPAAWLYVAPPVGVQ